MMRMAPCSTFTIKRQFNLDFVSITNRLILYPYLFFALICSIELYGQVDNNDEYIQNLRTGFEAADYAGLSAASYNDGSPVPQGYQRLDNYTSPPTESGFYAEVYQAGPDHPKAGEIVIAFRGTDDLNDVVTDVRGNVFNQKDAQYTQAFNFTQRIINDFGGNQEIKVTGHSLGGALAQYSAASHNLPAYTFNSAQVNERLRHGLGDQPYENIVNIVHADDPLNIGNLATEHLLRTTSHLGPVTIIDYEHENETGMLSRTWNFLTGGIIGYARAELFRIRDNHSIIPMRQTLESWRDEYNTIYNFNKNNKPNSKKSLDIEELIDPFKD